ncbi:MAG: cobalamin B12-binding domain-containing protein [Pseudomonadota bacterium]
MERDEKIIDLADPDKSTFDRAESLAVLDNRTSDHQNRKGKEGISAYLAALLRTHVLSEAIKRLEKRNVTEQVLDRRVENFSRLVAAYALNSDLTQFEDEDDGAPRTEVDLIKQLLSLTGDLRGGFKVLERGAQILGEAWESDAHNFLEVTFAMTRLQLLMRKLVERGPQGGHHSSIGKALVAVPTGETHTFGQCMLEEILRAHGWQTRLFNPQETSSLAQHIKREGAHLVCFSWISSNLQSSVEEELDAVRSMPILTRPIIIAGGQAALEKDKWIVSHGVDQICDSAYAATEIASKITEAIEKSAQKSGRHEAFESAGGQG